MGKYIVESEFNRELEKNNKYIFRVRFSYGGRRHTEKFSMRKKEVEVAKKLGLLKFNGKGYAEYLDWKPINGAYGMQGGVKKVLKMEKDDKYVYAYTREKKFSLPIYLENKITRKDFILFGYRED